MPFKFSFKKKEEPKPQAIPEQKPDPEPLAQEEDKAVEELAQDSVETPLLAAEEEIKAEQAQEIKEEIKEIIKEENAANEEHLGDRDVAEGAEADKFASEISETKETEVVKDDVTETHEQTPLKDDHESAKSKYDTFADSPEGTDIPAHTGILCCTII